MAHAPYMEPADAFAQLGRIKLSETDLNGVFHQIADLAKRTIPCASEVSVTPVSAEGAYPYLHQGECQPHGLLPM